MFTVSFSEDVWGVSESSNDVLVHSQKVVTFTDIVNDEDDCAKDGDWEIVHWQNGLIVWKLFSKCIVSEITF